MSRTRKHADFVEAALAMQVGDPPLRWTCLDVKLSRTLFMSLHRLSSGTKRFWSHFYKGEIWVVRYE